MTLSNAGKTILEEEVMECPHIVCNITLSKSSKILLAEKMKEFFAKEITAKEYLTAVKAIYSIEHEIEHNKNLQGQEEWVKTSYRNQALEQL